MAEKGGLQLLPETRKKIDIRVPGENRFIYAGVGLIVLMLGTYGGLAWYRSSLETELVDIDGRLVAMEQQRNKQAEQKLITLAKQMALTAKVIKDHVSWTTGLSHIEAALQQNIQFKSLSAILGEQSVRMRALSDNYSTIARQLASFVADDAVKDITLDGVNVLTSGKLDFNAKLTFDKAKFLKNTR